MFPVSVRVCACLVCALFSAAAGARDIAAGTVQLSGGSRFNTTSGSLEEDNSSADVDVSSSEMLLDVAYYLQDNVAVGIGYARDYTKVEDVEETTIAFGPQMVLNVSTSEVSSLQLFGAFLLVDSELSDAGGSIGSSGSGFGFGANMALFFAPAAATTFGVSYVTLNESIDDSDIDFTSNAFSFGVGLTVLLD